MRYPDDISTASIADAIEQFGARLPLRRDPADRGRHDRRARGHGVRGAVNAGYVPAMPVGLEVGVFGDQGLDVKLSQPFPTGVDSRNAAQSGEADVIQVGTPASAPSCSATTWARPRSGRDDGAGGD